MESENTTPQGETPVDDGIKATGASETSQSSDDTMETEDTIQPTDNVSDQKNVEELVQTSFKENDQAPTVFIATATNVVHPFHSEEPDIMKQSNPDPPEETTATQESVSVNDVLETPTETPTESGANTIPTFNSVAKTNSSESKDSECFVVKTSVPDSENVTKKSEDNNQCLSNEIDSVKSTSSKPAGCYCGKDRDLSTVELQCAVCFKWFHQMCITISLGKCLPFMTNYTFVCKCCNPMGTESFIKRQSNFSQICMTAIANLMQESISRGKPKSLFLRDKEIVPFIDRNWAYLTTMQRRIKQTWHNTVQKTMLKDGDIFVCEESLTENNLETQQLFGIAMQDLYKIGPDYENKLGHNAIAGLPGFNLVGKSRGAKRKVPSDNFASSASKKPKSDLVIPKLPPHGYPLEHPFNKDGYRYIIAEPDPHAPFRQEFDESSDWAGKPIPGWLYRTLVPNSVLLAMHDRGPQLRVSEDRLSVTGEKGYCMIRATHGVGEGSWYFEVNIDDMPEGSATRLGWCQALGNLQAPLGFDKFGYSWRSRKGTKFHQSSGYHYSDVGYGQGDVLGFLIELPPEDEEAPPPLPPTYKEKPLVKFKSYLYFEEKDEVSQALKDLRTLPRSKITFFKNGVCMGVAWKDIFSGMYYPAISLYKSCTVSVNFGPNLKFPPENVSCQYMYEAAHKALIDQTVSDLVYFTENDGKLRLDSFMS